MSIKQEFREVLVTPDKAKELLGKNISNRRVKDQKIDRYAKDMKMGKWKRGTCEFIKIASNGRILDGQHRLLAIIKSGTSCYLQFAYNVEEGVFDVLDTGSNRNGSDVFKIAGVKNESTLPSIIQQCYQLKNGNVSVTSVAQQNRLTNAELLQEYLKDEQFWQDVARRSMVWYDAFAKILQPSVIGGFYAFFSSIHPESAYDFMDQLTTGRNIENDVVNQLRNRLMKDKISLLKMPAIVKYGNLIKAWNAYRQSKTVKILRFDPEKESFPIAV